MQNSIEQQQLSTGTVSKRRRITTNNQKNNLTVAQTQVTAPEHNQQEYSYSFDKNTLKLHIHRKKQVPITDISNSNAQNLNNQEESLQPNSLANRAQCSYCGNWLTRYNLKSHNKKLT